MDRTFEEMLVRQCAPTLAGLKPGSLFCITAEDLENVRKKVRFWDQRLEVLGLSVRILLERREAVPRQPARAVPRSDGSPRFSGGDGVQGERDRANAGPAGGAPVGPIGFST